MIKIGSRPSKLAVTQSRLFLSALKAAVPQHDYEIIEVKTTGDQKQALSNVARDKKDWIVELEEAIINGDIDLALHSAKDVPYEVSDKTIVLPVMQRAAANDVFIGKMQDGKRLRFSDLQNGDCIGTASLRRQAQIKLANNNFEVSELRGNVTSRIEKLDQNPDLQGIVLAAAGLGRLGMNLEEFELFPVETMLPAACQGILAAHCSTERKDILEMLSKLVDSDTNAQFLAERAFIRGLKADCHSAVSCFSQVKDGKLSINAKVFGRKSLKLLSEKALTDPDNAEEAGLQLSEKLITQGARELLDE